MVARIFAGMLILCVGLPALAQAQSASGAMIGNTCAGCHGTQGAALDTRIPPLAGVDEAEFIATMNAYAKDTRRGSIMNRVAKAYSDAEIAALAAYFASFPKQVAEEAGR